MELNHSPQIPFQIPSSAWCLNGIEHQNQMLKASLQIQAHSEMKRIDGRKNHTQEQSGKELC